MPWSAPWDFTIHRTTSVETVNTCGINTGTRTAVWQSTPIPHDKRQSLAGILQYTPRLYLYANICGRSGAIAPCVKHFCPEIIVAWTWIATEQIHARDSAVFRPMSIVDHVQTIRGIVLHVPLKWYSTQPGTRPANVVPSIHFMYIICVNH